MRIICWPPLHMYFEILHAPKDETMAHPKKSQIQQVIIQQISEPLTVRKTWCGGDLLAKRLQKIEFQFFFKIKFQILVIDVAMILSGGVPYDHEHRQSILQYEQLAHEHLFMRTGFREIHQHNVRGTSRNFALIQLNVPIIFLFGRTKILRQARLTKHP